MTFNVTNLKQCFHVLWFFGLKAGTFWSPLVLLVLLSDSADELNIKILAPRKRNVLQRNLYTSYSCC